MLQLGTKRIIQLIIIILIILCLFSLYLSTQILQSQNHSVSIPSMPSQKLLNDKEIISNKKKNEIQSEKNDRKLIIALQKSLKMYLLREGHDDRVEYMIGFRGQRISDSIQYTKLSPRNMDKQYNRDYKNGKPVSISGWESQPESEIECDAYCRSCNNDKCDINGVKWSMENVEVSESSNIITGSTRLDSLVPVPYFSYWDFGFMTPINSDKSADGLAAAFISNCGFPKRNNMVRDLQIFGVSIDSYGRCQHNKEEERSIGGREETKIDLLSAHKFSLAFENSETDDYISEKFFGSLVSGSIPVYIGAQNIKFFTPDAGIYGAGKPWKSHSVIYAGDFDFNANKLAKYLLYLDGNSTAYNEYIQWKKDGFSGDFKALVELTSATHTNCRQCILATDWSRYKHGITKYDEAINTFDYGQQQNNNHDTKSFFVRERGMYRFTLIRIEENTLEMFVKNVLQSIKPKKVNKWKNNEHPHYDRIGPALYGIYHVPTKHVIHSDEAIQNLQNYVELEVIFV